MVARSYDQQIKLTPIHDRFGVRVSGIDIRQPVDSLKAAAIRSALDDHSLLIFEKANVNVRQQVEFSRIFGPLEIAISALSNDEFGCHVSNLSNIDEDGSLIAPDDKAMLSNAANRLWHTDSTFKPIPALASLLSAITVPPTGGATEFACTRAAWDDLDPARRCQIDGRIALHDFSHSRQKIAPNLVDDQLKIKLPVQRRPMVRVNPATNRKSIYLASHAKAIDGMEDAEALALIDDITQFCTRDVYVHTHHWQPGDLVVWDNRATMHRGRPWSDTREPRIMYRTTVEDISAPELK